MNTTIRLLAVVIVTMPSDENNMSARYSGVSIPSRFRYDTATSSASAVALTMMTPRNTPKPSTRTIPAIVVIGPSSRTRCHCQNSITPAVITPAAASAYPTGVAAARRRSNARQHDEHRGPGRARARARSRASRRAAGR